MRKKDINLYSLAKITTHEILVEEQLEYTGTHRFRSFKIYKENQKNLKRKIFLSKIFGSVIFGILPIIPFLTYFQILDYSSDSSIPVSLILFAGSVLFGIYFLLVFLNFFLMSMLNITKIISGKIFEWYNTFPIKDKKIRRILILTIIRSSDIPLLVITIALPIVMFIGTQNLLIFISTLGISILNTIFCFSILVIFGERLNLILDINKSASKRTHTVRLINMIIYILIIIISIFIIQWLINSLNTFFAWFVNQPYPALLILILSLIPFPFSPGYFISSFVYPTIIDIRVWYNILVGLSLFIILTYVIFVKSLNGLKRNNLSKFRNSNQRSNSNFEADNFRLKFKIKSPIKAHLHKDVLIIFRDLKTFVSIFMPIILGFIFTFTYNMTNVRGITPLDIDFIVNWYVIVGFNLVISSMLIYSLLSMEDSGTSILASLPFIPRNQAISKLILICIVQTIALITPTIMYLNNPKFINLFLSTLGTLPLVLISLFLMFEMRIYFFGKMRFFYVVEEIYPEHRMLKWFFIFFLLFIAEIVFLSIMSIIYLIYGLKLFIISLSVIYFLGFICVILIFNSIFSKGKVISRR